MAITQRPQSGGSETTAQSVEDVRTRPDDEEEPTPMQGWAKLDTAAPAASDEKDDEANQR